MSSSGASMRVVLRSVGIWAFVGMTTFFFSLPVFALFVVWAPFDRRRRPALWVMRMWSRTLMRANPMWSVRVRGLERLDRRAAYVFASNHQSHADILVFGFLDHPYIYMAKRELFRVPILGWGMWCAGCIPVRRGDKESAREAMAQAAERLRQGVSLLIFPEGTRSRDGAVGPFKDGAFSLAIQTGRAVVPIAVHGSRTVLPKGSWLFTERSRVEVEVLEPVPVDGLDLSDAPELRERVRESIVRKVADLATRRGDHG